MLIFFPQEEGSYIMTNFSIRFEVLKAAFESVLKSPEFQFDSLKTLVWFCSVNIKKPLINSKLIETAEHDEFCWQQQMPGFLQKGVTITWFYQFASSFFDSRDVLHPYYMFVSIGKNFVPCMCSRRTCHVLHEKLCRNNSLSHYTNFFPIHLRLVFCSCCLFACLFAFLKVDLVIEKNHLMDSNGNWPLSPLSPVHLDFTIVLMGWPFGPKRIIKSPGLLSPEFENNMAALLTRLHRKSRVSRLRLAITFLLLKACQTVPFSYNPLETDLRQILGDEKLCILLPVTWAVQWPSADWRRKHH